MSFSRSGPHILRLDEDAGSVSGAEAQEHPSRHIVPYNDFLPLYKAGYRSAASISAAVRSIGMAASRGSCQVCFFAIEGLGTPVCNMPFHARWCSATPGRPCTGSSVCILPAWFSGSGFHGQLSSMARVINSEAAPTVFSLW